MRYLYLLILEFHTILFICCLGFINSTASAQSQRYAQIDVRVVGGNQEGLEITKIGSVKAKAWDTIFWGVDTVPPDIRICVDNSKNCVKGNCPNLYFCSFIGVPIKANTFNLEIWDEDIQSFVNAGDDLIGKGSVGINRSYQLGEAQVTVTEIPCSDKEIQVFYEPEEPTGHFQFDDGFKLYPSLVGQNSSLIRASYHHFERSKEICKITTPGCELKTVYQTMVSQVHFIAPSEDKTPVVNCKKNELIAMTSAFGGRNPVRTTMDAKNFTIVNYTLEKHIFYPGKITRKIIKNGNSIVVTTEGVGFGQYAVFNEFFGKNVLFAEIDDELAVAVSKNLKVLR